MSDEQSSRLARSTTITKTYFTIKGYKFADDIFKAYLDNNGPDFVYQISPSNVERMIATAGAREQVAKCVDTIKEQARLDPRTGVTQDITTAWMGAPQEEGDIGLAVGHYDVGLGSDTTLYMEDGRLRAEIIYRIYIYEYYNFDLLDQKSYDLNIKDGVNNDMRILEEVGWARSFRVHGEAPRLERWVGDL
ncbi:hypothetical protein [Nocardia sp. NPDC051750]|uniref:hypothetical protein n=1 Tax=Nocardia sp. NPDC051750 TaxID=3364325 RepID=UPI00379B9EB6